MPLMLPTDSVILDHTVYGVKLLPGFAGNDLCYDLPFLDGTFLFLSTVAPWK
jgi:hypothetical protein